MKLYYHKDFEGNFGDDLNPWLWRQLLPNFFDGVCYHNPQMRSLSDTNGGLFIGIGTLLNRRIPTDCNKVVFGTGAGYGELPKVDDSWNFYCVRGPLTAAKLGINPSLAITDAAMLVRRIGMTAKGPQHPISFMPHFSNAKFGAWEKVCAEAQICFIDPRRSVDEILQKLRCTDMLLTEAMHGAIVADALRVPWVAVKTTPSILNFKWCDWCQSLNLDYKPIRLPTLWSLPENPKLSNRIIYGLKSRAALEGLRKAARKAKPVLSNVEVLDDAVGRLEDCLERFKENHMEQKFK